MGRRLIRDSRPCFVFVDEHPNYCRQHHGHVVHLETAAENMFVRDFLRGLKAEHHWLGLTDEIVEGQWIWYDTNTQTNIFDWGPGEPNSSGREEDCVVFDFTKDYQWTDTSCTDKYEPVCEVSAADMEVIG